jgi:hypothetical protein
MVPCSMRQFGCKRKLWTTNGSLGIKESYGQRTALGEESKLWTPKAAAALQGQSPLSILQKLTLNLVNVFT